MPARKPPGGSALSAYRAKRSADQTPEPAGILAAPPGGDGGRFVVHKHAARRLHYDLRLEMDGVLKSWAVPKGPSRNPAEKRLAVHVEDHPLEYGDFEGLIPEGNYGAGAVIVWDRGRWIPLEDPATGMQKGKLLFELRGYKLRGRWTLVKIKKGKNEWLLIKERDGEVRTNGAAFPECSVLSGLAVDQLRDPRGPAASLRQELTKLGAPQRLLRADSIGPMLAQPRAQPFTRSGWVFEVKLDGYRLRAARLQDGARLLTRNGRDVTRCFPEVARAVAALPYDGLILDGEVIVLDPAGRPSFQQLQNRAGLSRAPDVKRAAVEHPATFFAFDLIACEGFDLRPLPLIRRKALLRRVLPEVGPLRYSEHFEQAGEALYREVVRLGLEGIVAKRAESAYRSGRSDQWLKIRADRTGDFVVVGYTTPKGTRGGFGALHIADFVDGRLTYAGRVGSGFTARQLRALGTELKSARRDSPACDGGVPTGRGHVWVEPRRVIEVRYKEWTGDGLLRHPVFLRFRDDKEPGECIRQAPIGGAGTAEKSLAGAAAALSASSESAHRSAVREVKFTNLDKVFWPEEGYTKGDLIAYYRAIAPWMLPYLAERPLVLTRYPDGIGGKSFFQKDAPKYAHDFVRTVTIWSADSQRELDYFVCGSETELSYMANLAAVLLHVWSSRVETLELPDWCILDLDPKGAPFTNVVRVARAVKALCDDIGLPVYAKTSGSTGLHTLIPLGRQCTYEQSRTLGGLLARVVAAELPEIATITRQVHKREGKVYLDYVQNGHGRLLVAPYSARPLPRAPVSMPLEWREVNGRLDIHRFTIRTAPARVKRWNGDPLLAVLTDKPDLVGALERLHERLQA